MAGRAAGRVACHIALPSSANNVRPLERSAGMNCWHCRRTAVATCRFCGRGVCENHVTTRPFILALLERSEPVSALVVEDAVFCGACHPRPNPVNLPELD